MKPRRTRAAQPSSRIDSEARNLERRIWTNWLVIAGVSVLTTCGLAAGLLPFVRGSDSPWPWKSTESLLLCLLIAAVTGLTAYLTCQQRKLSQLHAQLELMQEEALARVRRHYDRLMALLSVSQIMGSENDVKTILDTITSTCLRTFDCEQVSLMVLEIAPGQSDLVVRSAAGHIDPSLVLGSRQKLGEGVAGRVAVSREPLILGPAPPPGSQGAASPQTSRLSASMVVPILVRGELVGVLNAASRRKDARYDDEDLRALQVFAENAGTCIRHAEQANWMRKTIATLSAESK